MEGGWLAVVSALACIGVQLMGQSHIALGEGETELPSAPVFLPSLLYIHLKGHQAVSPYSDRILGSVGACCRTGHWGMRPPVLYIRNWVFCPEPWEWECQV